MQQDRFRALVLDQEDGATRAVLKDVPRDALPDGDVTVAVTYSSLNYKDGLAVTGQGRIVRSYPMVPGIDLAGTVVASESPDYKPGDEVVLTGWGIGERHWGGYAEMARVKSAWLVPLPRGLTARQAMALGTAGFTAMLCVMALEDHGVGPSGRPVIVTGAAGGVGSVAVALLAQRGYTVAASTGRSELHDYLKGLGASEIIERAALAAPSTRPLESERWGGGVDTVGSTTLAAVLRATAYGGSVAACGLAGGNDLPTTVLPFILRAVNLLGIDSVLCPPDRRRTAWERLARDVPSDTLDRITQVAPLADVPRLAGEILQGRVRGRVIIDVRA
ncbi:MAG TPA: MDR family oxidoreductase [Chloroflexota bacterium]|jgi:acrylyl-CoA reductase (NADPH)|nr:MDR family oxidoreductase [Chloroflexota bacterium]